MLFSLKPRRRPQIIEEFLRLLTEAMPAGDGRSERLVEWTPIDELTTQPGIFLTMRTEEANYTASFIVTMSHSSGYGLRAAVDEQVTLVLHREHNHEMYAERYGGRKLTYRRRLRSPNGELITDLDEFLAQVVQSLVFFFTHGHPGAMVEFSDWVHPTASRPTCEQTN